MGFAFFLRFPEDADVFHLAALVADVVVLHVQAHAPALLQIDGEVELQGLVVLQGVDEVPYEPRLPHDGFGIDQDVLLLEYDGDELHMFRIKTLHKLYSIIFGYSGVNVFEQFERKDLNGLTVWGEERQAEIQNTSYLPLRARVTLHIRLLRYLRKGFSVVESLERIKNAI